MQYTGNLANNHSHITVGDYILVQKTFIMSLQQDKSHLYRTIWPHPHLTLSCPSHWFTRCALCFGVFCLGVALISLLQSNYLQHNYLGLHQLVEFQSTWFWPYGQVCNLMLYLLVFSVIQPNLCFTCFRYSSVISACLIYLFNLSAFWLSEHCSLLFPMNPTSHLCLTLWPCQGSV